MHLTEEMPESPQPRTAAERQKCIKAREKYLLTISVDKNKYSKDVVRAASRFLAVLAYCDNREPLDPSLLSDETGSSSGSPAGSADRGAKRPAPDQPQSRPPKGHKKRRTTSPIPAKTQVACLTEPNGYPEWVLGRVARYVPESKKYEVIDEDADGDVYRVSRKNIRVIPKKPQNFEPKQRVLAVYPLTTVFYPASLVKKSGKNWLVEFDDEDANTTRLKEVQGHYVMLE